MKIDIPFKTLTSFSFCYSFLFHFSFLASLAFSSKCFLCVSERTGKIGVGERHRHASLNTRCSVHKWKFFSDGFTDSEPKEVASLLALPLFLCFYFVFVGRMNIQQQNWMETNEMFALFLRASWNRLYNYEDEKKNSFAQNKQQNCFSPLQLQSLL